MAGGSWRLSMQPATGVVSTIGNPAVVPVPGQLYTVAPTLDAFKAQFGKGVAGADGFDQPSNLLGRDRPTVMTNWALTSVYLPASAFYGAGIGQLDGVVLTMTVRLRVNTQVVWQESQLVAATKKATPSYEMWVGSFTFSADLVNRVTVGRGDRLGLDCQVGTNLVDADPNSFLRANFNATPDLSVNIPNATPSEGIIGYDVVQLPGRRQL